MPAAGKKGMLYKSKTTNNARKFNELKTTVNGSKFLSVKRPRLLDEPLCLTCLTELELWVGNRDARVMLTGSRPKISKRSPAPR